MMSLRVSIMAVSVGLTAILVSSACADQSSPSNRETESTKSISTVPFDPCEDIVADFYTKYAFDYPPTPTGHGFVVGPNEGQGCRFEMANGYHVIVEMTDDPVKLGTAIEYDKLVRETITIGDRPAEIARTQNRSDAGGSIVSSESCDINVELPQYMVTFYFSNSGLSDNAPEPCEKLTEIATDIVTMLPAGE